MMTTPESGRVEILPAEFGGIVLRAIDRNGRVVAQQTVPRIVQSGNTLQSHERDGRVVLDSVEEPSI